MRDVPTTCPECGSTEIHFRKSRGDWSCDHCEHKWTPTEPADSSPPPTPKARLFLSYGRRDAEELADRLDQDLSFFGYDVWRDTRKIRSGTDFLREIEDGLRSTQLVVALLSPHAVREPGDPDSPDDLASVCLDELHLARFSCKVPIVPVMVASCRPPFVIFRLDYVEMLQWRDFGEAYERGFRKLLEAIETAQTSPQKVWRYRRWDERLQPFDFADFLFTKRRDFCGREWLFAEIERWRTEPDRQRALLITGDPGIGKSAIVAQLIHANAGGQVLAHHCCQFRSRETLRPGRFIRSVAAQIASQLEGYAAQLDDPKVEAALGEGRCLDDPFGAFEEGILGPLHSLHAPSGGARYLLIDALDEALAHREGPSIVDLLAARLDRLPGWLRLVATARKDPEVLRRLSGLRAEEIKADDPRNLDDVERFLAHRLDQPALRARLDRSRVPAEQAIGRLREKSGGNFLWVEQALLGLESDSYEFDRLDALPPGLTGLYGAFFERHFPDAAAYAPARRVLEVVLAALEPLSPAELAAATGLDPDYELPALLDLLAAYLPERAGRRAIYHKSFSDWLTETKEPRPAGRFFVSPHRGHEWLADWCWSDFRRDPRRMSPYALRHLPAHLMAAARWDDLANLLRDLPYLETKTEAGLVFDLAMDFTQVVDGLSANHPARRHLRLIDQALRSDLHFLARHPTALFQCLWNRCWWYDCPEAAAHYDPPPRGWPAEGPPWSCPAADRLSTLLQAWRDAKERSSPGVVWLRSLRPPELALGGPQLACFRGHASWVRTVAYSPDGRRIVSGSDDDTVRVWDAQSGAALACLRGHAEAVRSVAYSPDGHRIVTVSLDNTVRLWDADSGAELACLRGHAGPVWSVAYSPDGRRIASASDDQTVRVWDAQSSTELACLRGHVDWVGSVAYSPDGRRIVSGSWDRTVRVWDAGSGAELACLSGHASGVTSVAYSPDGRRIVSGSIDRTARVWDADSGVKLACLRGHEFFVNSVGYSLDGHRIVTGSADHTVRVWDAANGVELASFRGHSGSVYSVAYSPDGRRIVSAARDLTVRVWTAMSDVELARLHGHTDPVQSVAHSPDGRRIVSGSADHTVRVWDGESGVELTCLRGHAGWVDSVAYSPDGRHIVSGSIDQTIRVWDTASGECLEVMEGSGDAASIVVAEDAFPWRAMSRDLETVIEPTAGGNAVAWFPGAMNPIATHPSGRIWAGSVRNHLYLIRLEGEPDSRPPAEFRDCDSGSASAKSPRDDFDSEEDRARWLGLAGTLQA